MGSSNAGLFSFLTLGAEDLRAPLDLGDPRRVSWIRLSPANMDSSGPQAPGRPPKRPIHKPGLKLRHLFHYSLGT
ncbi:hypothetical protein TNCV_564621 [Trichonephila clavipes]|nr:hypothetical protein TNCV_564621 [Trichonephila clavipes]